MSICGPPSYCADRFYSFAENAGVENPIAGLYSATGKYSGEFLEDFKSLIKQL